MVWFSFDKYKQIFAKLAVVRKLAALKATKPKLLKINLFVCESKALVLKDSVTRELDLH